MRSGFVISHTQDFDYAIHLKKYVEVYQYGILVDSGGLILSHTENSVKFKKGKYLKAVSEFKIR